MRLLPLYFILTAITGCASGGVTMQPEIASSEQQLIRENKQPGIYSDKPVSVAVVPRSYRVGEPMLIGIRLYNNTEQLIDFDPLKDVQVSLDEHRLKVWNPADAPRPRMAGDAETAAVHVGFGALDLFLNDRLRLPVALVGLFGEVRTRQVADEEFKRELLKPGTILPKQSLSGYVVVDSYHPGMVKVIDPSKSRDDGSNRQINEDYKGKYQISVNVAGNSHAFSFAKKAGLAE